MNWSVFMHLRVHVIVCRAVCPDNCQLCSYGGVDSTDKIVPVGTIRCLECNVGYHYTSPTECSG